MKIFENNYGFLFRGWSLYKNAREYRKSMTIILRTFPKEEQFALTDQTRRALLSIILNIAESSNKNTDKDSRAYINRAQCSLDEVVACFDCAKDEGYITNEKHNEILEKSQELAKQLNGFNKYLSKTTDNKTLVKDQGLDMRDLRPEIKDKGLGIRRGFTAIEMLLVVAFIIILLGIATITFRDQGPKNRNAERRNEVNAIADALVQWSFDNNTSFGAISPAIPVSATCVTSATCIGTGGSCYNLSFLSTQYLNSLPEDPKNTNGQSNIGYKICKDAATKEIIIGAPMAENGEVIEARRK